MVGYGFVFLMGCLLQSLLLVTQKKGLPKFSNVLIQHPMAQTHTIQLHGNKGQRQHVDRIIGTIQ